MTALALIPFLTDAVKVNICRHSRRKRVTLLLSSHSRAMLPLLTLILLLLTSPQRTNAVVASDAKVKHVVHIVVDGLRPDAMAGNPNFDYMVQNGACTGNARLDPLSSQTLPNHISMFTGHPTSDHGYLLDLDDGGYLPNGRDADIFDLVHASGGTTGFFGSKEKFAIFNRSWKIDEYHYQKRSRMIVPIFLEQMLQRQFKYVFLHIRAPDRAGHADVGADSVAYRNAVAEADEYLGQVISLAALMDRDTGIILTADHGFASVGNHADESDVENYRIPFCVLGPGVAAGADLYGINAINGYVDPGEKRANDSESVIRNVYAGILAADWLGLHPGNGPLSHQNLALSDASDGIDFVGAADEGDVAKDSDPINDEVESDALAPIDDETVSDSIDYVPADEGIDEPVKDSADDSSNMDGESATGSSSIGSPTNTTSSGESPSTKQIALYILGAVIISVGVGAIVCIARSGRLANRNVPRDVYVADKAPEREDTVSISSDRDDGELPPASVVVLDKSTSTTAFLESTYNLSQEDLSSSIEILPTSPRYSVDLETCMVSTETNDAVEVLNYNIHQVA